MKALVIGGNGFIGSHLVDKLIQNNWEVSILDLHERRYDKQPPDVNFTIGDINQTYLVREALSGVDVVYHLAWASIHEVSNQDLCADINSNIIPTVQLLEECCRSGIKRIIFTSSGGTVYGPSDDIIISESHPQNPINGYGIGKVTIEKYLSLFKHLYDLDYVVLRPSVPYGPRQNPLARQGAVAVFLYRIASQMPITVWGDGRTTRDYFYISDLTSALIKAASTTNLQYNVLNLGGNKEISLLDIIDEAQRITGKKAIINYQNAREFDVQRLNLDISRAWDQLNWKPLVPFNEGLLKTWEWMKSTIYK